MTTNFNYVFSIFHPEYLVELLRAGGRFPAWQTFSLPMQDTSKVEIREFINTRFPSLSEGRDEIWLKFRFSDQVPSCYLLKDIESAHFFNRHRMEAISQGVLHTLNVYGIPIGESIQDVAGAVIEQYSELVREQTANTIVAAWFPQIVVSNVFIKQLQTGYVHQQSPTPEKLAPIPSEFIWAHLVAYNPGLRKFVERKSVLQLQDVQEILKRTDQAVKNSLKEIGDKHNTKFSDIIDDAEGSIEMGIMLSKWLVQKRAQPNTYITDLDTYLSSFATQESFLYSSLLYLYWREEILNKGYNGYLGENTSMRSYLHKLDENPLRQAIAEALFTIVYAGGPLVFQKALIEARMKILHLPQSKPPNEVPPLVIDEETKPIKPIMFRLFDDARKELGKFFQKLLDDSPEKKKSKIIKAIGLSKTKIGKGEFDYDQYVKLCVLFEMEREKFEQQRDEGEFVKTTDNLLDIESAEEINENEEAEVKNAIENDKQNYTVENKSCDGKQTEAQPIVDTKDSKKEVEGVDKNRESKKNEVKSVIENGSKNYSVKNEESVGKRPEEQPTVKTQDSLIEEESKDVIDESMQTEVNNVIETDNQKDLTEEDASAGKRTEGQLLEETTASLKEAEAAHEIIESKQIALKSLVKNDIPNAANESKLTDGTNLIENAHGIDAVTSGVNLNKQAHHVQVLEAVEDDQEKKIEGQADELASVESLIKKKQSGKPTNSKAGTSTNKKGVSAKQETHFHFEENIKGEDKTKLS